jgi:heme exporter protein C
MTRTTLYMLALAAGMFAVAPWIINAAPNEATMGLVYKIYFFHMPSAWMFLVAALTAGFASARFLFFKKQSADGWAMAAAELTVLFGAFTLVSGPLWARKAWGVWWQWDPRLTSSLVLFLMFVAYLLLRRFGGPGSDKLGAGMAIFSTFNVIFVWVSVNYWRTIHPPTSVVPTLPVEMGIPLWFCVIAFTLLFIVLLRMRARLEHQRARVEALYLAEES